MNLVEVVKSTMWKLSIKYFDHFFFSTECFWLKILIPANGVLSIPAKDEKTLEILATGLSSQPVVYSFGVLFLGWRTGTCSWF